ncbi:hypothetical protein PanWU01x14_369750 [Parasponia andersonii]|uniref:Uncharacterized protein n=1 Tax=Parasponia andersonii TaxID=3476 RepID=A0A2P5A4I0_PARAD|nr:hypothetical protein PanWU01x14_369750 [Parasponia andersonii]
MLESFGRNDPQGISSYVIKHQTFLDHLFQKLESNIYSFTLYVTFNQGVVRNYIRQNTICFHLFKYLFGIICFSLQTITFNQCCKLSNPAFHHVESFHQMSFGPCPSYLLHKKRPKVHLVL